jgi:hypothetical protein
VKFFTKRSNPLLAMSARSRGEVRGNRELFSAGESSRMASGRELVKNESREAMAK